MFVCKTNDTISLQQSIYLQHEYGCKCFIKITKICDLPTNQCTIIIEFYIKSSKNIIASFKSIRFSFQNDSSKSLHYFYLI